MGAHGLWAKSQLRRGIVATVGLAVVVALAGGIVLAAVSGASRTRSALPTFVERFRAEDLLVFSMGSLADQTALNQSLDDVPDVAAASADSFCIFASTDDQGRPIPGTDGAVFGIVAVDDDLLHTIQARKVVEGRLADPDDPTEVVANEALARAHDLDAGDEITVVAYAPDQTESAANDPTTVAVGPTFTFEITGIVRGPEDVSIQSRSNNTEAALLVGPAFWAENQDDVASYGVEGLVRATPGADLSQVEDAITERHPDVIVERAPGSLEGYDATQRAIDLQANAVLATGLAFALVAALLVGQSLVRRRAAAADAEASAGALGWSRRDRTLSAMVVALPVAVGGAIGAMAVAVAISPVFPIGTARAAELEPGVHVDAIPLLVGAAIIAAFVLVVTAGAGIRRHPRSRRRRDPVTGWVAASGAPVEAVLATSLPMDRRQRATTLLALGAGVLAVLTVAAGLLVHANVDDLIDRPEAWGQEWDVTVGIYGDPESAEAGVAPLRENPAVADFTSSSSATYSGDTVVVDGRVVGAVGLDAIQGDLLPTVLDGALPVEDTEIALGRRSLDAIGASIGDEVEVTVPDGVPMTMRITGEVLLPAAIAPEARIGDGAVLTMPALTSLRPGNDFAALYLVRFADGVSQDEGVESLRPAFGDTIERSLRPSDIESIDRVRALPWILAALVTALAAATVLHALVTGLRRQRHDLAVVKALGVTRRQLRRVGGIQTAAFVGACLAVGLPAGILIGRQIWQRVVDALGIASSLVIPITGLVLLVPLTLLAGVLLLALPSRAAARTDPARALRAD